MNNTKVELLKVSKDQGRTWVEKEVDIKQMEPELSVLEVGDWIERNGSKFEIYLTDSNGGKWSNKLQARRLSV